MTTSHALRRPIAVRGLPDPLTTPTLTVPEAGAILGLCKASSYTAAKAREIPTIRIGRRLIVPTARLLRMLGADHSFEVDVLKVIRERERAMDTANAIDEGLAAEAEALPDLANLR